MQFKSKLKSYLLQHTFYSVDNIRHLNYHLRYLCLSVLINWIWLAWWYEGTLLLYWTILYLRRLFASFPPLRPRFAPRSGHAGFLVDKVALGLVCSKHFGFPCQFSFQQMLHNHLSSGAGTTSQIGDKVPNGLSLTPSHKKIVQRIYLTFRYVCVCMYVSMVTVWTKRLIELKLNELNWIIWWKFTGHRSSHHIRVINTNNYPKYGCDIRWKNRARACDTKNGFKPVR
jgi:hypothetical protein